MMCDTMQRRGCHLGIAEDRDPLSKLQIGDDDGADLLIELADQIDSIEEARLLAVIDQGGSKRDGDMGFAGAGSPPE
ncbi:hypothetical protein GCM10011315_28090 [Roseovarius pacificus]|nr:hypothetical protein GCM10011315_28090 [Roseovarius pacificus]